MVVEPNFLHRLVDKLPVPFKYCSFCGRLHWMNDFKDEPNGAAYCEDQKGIPWKINSNFKPNDSNYVFGCYNVREYEKEMYDNMWDEYYSSITW